MRQHLIVTKMVAITATVLAGCGVALSQATSANVARVSFIQGSVQLMAGQGNDFQQTVMNMPVLDGSRLQTGGDGQAEVEFGDGSVARLTPNSTLQFDHMGQDQVQLEQLSGLGYYEFNVGQGHPPFTVQFSNLSLQPTTNSILRVALDAGWEVAVVTGGVNVQGGFAPVPVGENQSIRAGADNSGAPYTIAQAINPDSWDAWNQDRDQAIAQEASEQTPVRDDSGNPQNENWNDLDANGDWYPVEGAGNVWVPNGVGSGWDPYGAGYWAFYPTIGYTWVSAYPWGWLPYHCGAWGYYSFGWGWAPGGCGSVWSPVIVVRTHPPGWIFPVHPVYPPGGIRPMPVQRLVAVDRGPVAKGPWAYGYAPRTGPATLNFNGRTIEPIARVSVQTQGLVSARGVAPGSRAVLTQGNAYTAPRTVPNSFYGANPPRAYENPTRPGVGYSAPAVQSYNQRSTYVARPAATPHYSAPPPSQPHFSAPPPSQPHYSAPPPAAHPAPSGGVHR